MDPGDPIPPPSAQTDTPVHCAECGKYNERDAVTCAKCGSHLWVKCNKCSHKNIRTASRCAKCHKRLRSARLELPRFGRAIRNRKQKRVLYGFGLLTLLILVVWAVVQSVPEPSPPERNTAVSN